METWKNFVDAHGSQPEYIELVLGGENGGEIVFGLLLDGWKIDYETIPEGWHPYAIRHSDDDMGVPASLEKNVIVNFYGTVLLDHEVDLGKKGWVAIEDYGFWDWRDMAVVELNGHGLNTELADDWNRLEPIRSNIQRLASVSKPE